MPAAVLAGARRTAALWRSVRALQDGAVAATPVYGLPALYLRFPPIHGHLRCGVSDLGLTRCAGLQM
jgi:hypothetical protein